MVAQFAKVTVLEMPLENVRVIFGQHIELRDNVGNALDAFDIVWINLIVVIGKTDHFVISLFPIAVQMTPRGLTDDVDVHILSPLFQTLF